MLKETVDAETIATSERVSELSLLVGSPAREAREIRILRDGETAFPAMLELIAEALTSAAGRGVAVRVLYDPIGTLMVRGGSIARSLKGSGVDVRPFRPLSPAAPWTWTRVRHRDHRKSLCVDGEAAVVGRLCISDNWSPSSRGGQGWRDTALRVTGPVVGDVERAFDGLWQDDGAPTENPLADTGLEPPALMVAADHPGGQNVGRLYAWLAERATRSVDITDAYLVLPPRALEVLAAAARRGVAVRMMLPAHNNHRLAGAAARRSYQFLLEAGVEIWEWMGAMVHAKTAVVDEEISLVGSSNLDPLSMRRNYELNLLVVDPETGRAMGAMFDSDLENARRIDPAAWSRRPRWRRQAEAAARIFAPDL